jgi:hypothetical protein
MSPVLTRTLNTQLNNKINDIWLRMDSGHFLTSDSRQLYRAVKSEIPDITLRQIRDFLKTKPTYTRHRQILTRYPRARTIAYGIGFSVEADLSDMSKFRSPANRWTNFLLVVVDCFCMKMYVETLTSKKSSSVALALKKIFSRMPVNPANFCSDNGGEFINHTKRLLIEMGVKQHFATGRNKCRIVENNQKILKRLIFKYMTEFRTRSYVNVLPALVDSLNKRPMAILGVSPDEVNLNNETEIFYRMYGHMLADEKELRRKNKPKLAKGQLVRIILQKEEKDVFTKRYTVNFSLEIFRIKAVMFKIPVYVYKLEDLEKISVSGIFYYQQLSPVL